MQQVKRLEGDTIVVLGAGGLIGAKIVAATLEAGAQVVAADISPAMMEKKLSGQGVVDNKRLECVQLDITDEKGMKAFFSSRSDLTGAVNTTYPRNSTYGKHFFEVSQSSFNENVSLHLGSSFLFMQQCAEYFVKHKKKMAVVNLSSIYGVVAPKFKIYENTPMTMPVEYAAIKSALQHLTKYIVSYVCDSRFRINNVSPGGILDKQPEAFLQAYGKETHGAGMLSPDDMLGAILFLLSDDSQYITGQNLIVDDGFSL